MFPIPQLLKKTFGFAINSFFGKEYFKNMFCFHQDSDGNLAFSQ
jgi:hypothetical protein